MCCFTWATARWQQLLFVVLAAGLWCFTAGCRAKSPLFPQLPLKLQCAPRWEKALDRRLFTIQRSSRISISCKFAAPRYRLRADCSGERRTWPFNGIEISLSRAQSRLSNCPSPLPRLQQRCLSTSCTMGESISTIQRSPRISTSYKFAVPRYQLPPMALQTVQVSVEPHLSTTFKDRPVVP